MALCNWIKDVSCNKCICVLEFTFKENYSNAPMANFLEQFANVASDAVKLGCKPASTFLGVHC